jgi:hypothetical protein
MTNVEYIFIFANKHNFPKTECEVVFNAVDDGSGNDIHTTDDDIIAVRFDKSLVENEIKMEDIRFDIDSDFPEDVFDIWQKDMPDVSFRTWISMGRYVPTIIKNTEFFDELEMLTKEIQMKMESMFSNIEVDNGDSDYYYDDDDDDSDYEEDDED